MTLESRQGDLFASSDLDALAHGCNCAGAMGRGIAAEFRRRWPDMYAEYRARCQAGTFQLGDVFPWKTDDLVIYNLGTQRNWRSKAELSAITTSVQAMLDHAEASGVRAIGMPTIGAGLGGLPWTDIQERLRQLVASSPVRIVVHQLGDDSEPSG